MTPLRAYSGQIPALDSLITFGAKITTKKLGTRPTATNPWTYEGIFLRHQNMMHNIKYWDVNSGTVKTAKHDSKDKLQYGDDIHNRSLASNHLLEIFTGSSNHTTNRKPESIELKLKDEASLTATDVLNEILDTSEIPYAAKAAVAAKVQVSLEEQKRNEMMCNSIHKIRIKKMKQLYRRPNLLHLKHELETLDMSTNTYIHTTSHTVPIHNKRFHKLLGLIIPPHPDMKNSIELVEFQVRTTTHRHIRSWK